MHEVQYFHSNARNWGLSAGVLGRWLWVEVLEYNLPEQLIILQMILTLFDTLKNSKIFILSIVTTRFEADKSGGH